MKNRHFTRTGRSEAGVTIIEMLIAIFVLTVGLLAMAQLFVAATMNNALATNTSGGVGDAQRRIEVYKSEAATNGITSALITSGAYNESTGTCPAYVNATGVSAQWSKETIWVYDKAGSLVTSAGMTASSSPPANYTSAQLRAPSEKSRLVVVRLEPKASDARYNQTVMLSAIIRGK